MTDDRPDRIEAAIAQAEHEGTSWTNRSVAQQAQTGRHYTERYLAMRRAQAREGATDAAVGVVEAPPGPLAQARAAWVEALHAAYWFELEPAPSRHPELAAYHEKRVRVIGDLSARGRHWEALAGQASEALHTYRVSQVHAGRESAAMQERRAQAMQKALREMWQLVEPALQGDDIVVRVSGLLVPPQLPDGTSVNPHLLG